MTISDKSGTLKYILFLLGRDYFIRFCSTPFLASDKPSWLSLDSLLVASDREEDSLGRLLYEWGENIGSMVGGGVVGVAGIVDCTSILLEGIVDRIYQK